MAACTRLASSEAVPSHVELVQRGLHTRSTQSTTCPTVQDQADAIAAWSGHVPRKVTLCRAPQDAHPHAHSLHSEGRMVRQDGKAGWQAMLLLCLCPPLGLRYRPAVQACGTGLRCRPACNMYGPSLHHPVSLAIIVAQYLPSLSTCHRSVLAIAQYLPSLSTCHRSVLAIAQYLPSLSTCHHRRSVLAIAQYLPSSSMSVAPRTNLPAAGSRHSVS